MPKQLKPGAVIGIFGGGQLGMMLCDAARALGYKTHIYEKTKDCPAAHSADFVTAAAFDDLDAVRAFSMACDVVTFEFENIPAASLRAASEAAPVYPFAESLEAAQDRLVEKTFLKSAGAPVIDFYAVDSISALKRAAAIFDYHCVLKTRRFGYDGKGQVMIKSKVQLQQAFAALGGRDLILEKFAPFSREVSVIAARSIEGQIACFPVTENIHKNHILHTSTVPAPGGTEIEDSARKIAETILGALSYIGVMGIEFFVMAGDELVVNEIAPRVHNSGHWTLDAGCASQFTQHILAVTGHILSGTRPRHGVKMTNLIGDAIKDGPALAEKANHFFHDYKKSAVRPGRKMGHVNTIQLES